MGKLEVPQMQEFFKAIDVDQSEAKGLFHLLDLDNSGSVSAEEFINGCLRLRGPAKSLDLALLIQEVRIALSQLKRINEHIQKEKKCQLPRIRQSAQTTDNIPLPGIPHPETPGWESKVGWTET